MRTCAGVSPVKENMPTWRSRKEKSLSPSRATSSSNRSWRTVCARSQDRQGARLGRKTWETFGQSMMPGRWAPEACQPPQGVVLRPLTACARGS